MSMIPNMKCSLRGCKYDLGYVGENVPKTDPRYDVEDYNTINICFAFPPEVGGIPNSIAWGNNEHLKPLRGQKNNIVFDDSDWNKSYKVPMKKDKEGNFDIEYDYEKFYEDFDNNRL